MTAWLRDHPWGMAMTVLVVSVLMAIALIDRWPWQVPAVVLAILAFAWLKSLPWTRPPGGGDPQV